MVDYIVPLLKHLFLLVIILKWLEVGATDIALQINITALTICCTSIIMVIGELLICCNIYCWLIEVVTVSVLVLQMAIFDWSGQIRTNGSNRDPLLLLCKVLHVSTSLKSSHSSQLYPYSVHSSKLQLRVSDSPVKIDLGKDKT